MNENVDTKSLIEQIRNKAKKPNQQLNTFGNEFVELLLKNEFSCNDIAKILGVNASAIYERNKKLNSEN